MFKSVFQFFVSILSAFIMAGLAHAQDPAPLATTPAVVASPVLALPGAGPDAASIQPEEKVEEAIEEEESEPTEDELAQKALEKLQRERDHLAAENAIRQEKLRQELAALREEKERMSAQRDLEQEKLVSEFAERKQALERLNLEKEELAAKNALESTLRGINQEEELAALKHKEARLKLENSIKTAQLQSDLEALKIQDLKTKSSKTALDFELSKLDFELREREKKESLEDLASLEENVYTKEPLQGKNLMISDRRITLNGVIYYDTAKYVSERIAYFNNKSREYPIFIVIDNSPGGSVMAGYRILKAMQGSKAPVHVLVKSFAASMAAGICTLADTSYAYPNAIILHHQLSYGVGGNITQHSEMLDEAAEWYRRLAKPVAAKMGVTIEEFVRKMYENNSDGDWSEFADVAQKLKWVDHIVENVSETSILKNPDSKPVIRPSWFLSENQKVDEKGKPYVLLPRLNPFDAWWMYNPDRYYQNWWE